MTEELARLLADVRLVSKGATKEQIARAEAEMDCKLPEDVKALLREHDGGRGTLGHKQPFELWSIERIAEECEAQEVTRAVPGLVLFGSLLILGTVALTSFRRYYPAVGRAGIIRGAVVEKPGQFVDIRRAHIAAQQMP